MRSFARRSRSVSEGRWKIVSMNRRTDEKSAVRWKIVPGLDQGEMMMAGTRGPMP
jgi:hypothetical protein